LEMMDNLVGDTCILFFCFDCDCVRLGKGLSLAECILACGC
jgi:hypothetical protein